MATMTQSINNGDRALLARRRLNRAVIYFVIIALSLIFLVPLLYMFSMSLMPREQIGKWPPEWLPNPVQWDNYGKALYFWNFATSLRNTLTVTGIGMIGDLLSCTLVAYGFARFRFPGRDLLFMVLLGTLMLPFAVTMVPLYIGYNAIGWVNTFYPLIVPSFFGNAFYIFLLRQFFLTIPEELIDAARIDGANEFQIWWRILMPLAKPAIIVVAIFSFQNHWNDFLGPLLYLKDQNLHTLALGLYTHGRDGAHGAAHVDRVRRVPEAVHSGRHPERLKRVRLGGNTSCLPKSPHLFEESCIQ
jgi:multiple sugar transport system permease protein